MGLGALGHQIRLIPDLAYTSGARNYIWYH
jgi:hypothetical protein